MAFLGIQKIYQAIYPNRYSLGPHGFVGEKLVRNQRFHWKFMVIFNFPYLGYWKEFLKKNGLNYATTTRPKFTRFFKKNKSVN